MAESKNDVDKTTTSYFGFQKNKQLKRSQQLKPQKKDNTKSRQSESFLYLQKDNTKYLMKLLHLKKNVKTYLKITKMNWTQAKTFLHNLLQNRVKKDHKTIDSRKLEYQSIGITIVLISRISAYYVVSYLAYFENLLTHIIHKTKMNP